MNRLDFENAKESFRLKALEDDYKNEYAIRKKFVKTFTPDYIADMPIDAYVEGKENKDSFCYILERQLIRLGNMTGSTASKFGLYYSKKNKRYLPTKKYGTTVKEAFENIKKNILDLITAGKEMDLEAIVQNPISTMFKGKILSTYYPELYLNIFSEEHIDHYLTYLDLDTKELMKKDPVYKRQALLDFKNRDKDMKDWSVNMFVTFLCNYYPKAPLKKEEAAEGSKEEKIEFPTPEDISFVDMVQTSTKEPTAKGGSKPAPVDYEKEARKYKQLGDRGEYIVMQAETERVKEELGITLAKAKKLVKRVSLESDSYGYDILSVNKDGSNRYIEVKATRKECGDMDFYYTANELETAKKYGDDYYIYIVYEITTKYPKIWTLKNPFCNKESLELKPVKYKVRVGAKKK